MHRPAMMEFGSARLISPDGSQRVPDGFWPELELLILMEPRPDLLASWERSLEARFGVNEAHRKAMETSPEVVAQGIRRTHHQRAWGQRDRARQLGIADVPAAPESGIVSDLRSLANKEAAAKVARNEADSARARKDRNAHRAALGKLKGLQIEIHHLRVAIDRAHARQGDTRWAGFAVAETEALALSRGEELDEEKTEVADWVRDPETGFLAKGEDGLPVLRIEKGRAKRAISRSGLDMAFRKGDLGEGAEALRLLTLGRRYRQAYEGAAARMTPAAQEIRSTGVPEPQMSCMMAWDLINVMRGDKQVDDRGRKLDLTQLSRKQRLVLDQICGLDEVLARAAGKIRAGVPSVRRSLRGGLDTVGENLQAFETRKRPKK